MRYVRHPGARDDDRAVSGHDRAALSLGRVVCDRCAARVGLAGENVRPAPLGQRHVQIERGHQQTVAQHVFVQHIVVFGTSLIGQRERTHDGQPRLVGLMRRGIDVGEQLAAHLGVGAVFLLALVAEEPGHIPCAPGHVLRPGHQRAVVHAGKIGHVHVAGGVGMAAQRQIHDRDQRFAAAAGVARPCGAVLLLAGVHRGGVDHGAPAGVLGEALLHLLAVDHGIDIVYLLVGVAVGEEPVGMGHDLIGAVQLECVRAVVDELFEMLKPVLALLCELVHAAGGAEVRILNRRALCAGLLVAGRVVFFLPEQIVVAAQPQAQLVAHLMQIVDERPVAVIVFGQPVGHIEALGIPLFLSAEVVVPAHPARLKPHDVAGNFVAAEHHAVFEQIARVFALIVDECQAIGGLGQHHRPAGDARVLLQRALHVLREEHIHVQHAPARFDAHFVRLCEAQIIAMAERRVEHHAPAAAAHDVGDGTVAAHIGLPQIGGMAALHQPVAALVAQTEEPLAVLKRRFDREALEVVVLAQRFAQIELERIAGRGEFDRRAVQTRGRFAGDQRAALFARVHIAQIGAHDAVARQHGLALYAAAPQRDAENALGQRGNGQRAAAQRDCQLLH